MVNGIIGRGIFVLIFAMVFSNANGQTTIFSETFNEANGSTSGTSGEFIGWNASCPNCVAGYYEVVGGALEQNNSKGVTTFITDPMDISHCSTIELAVHYTGTDYSPSSGNFLDSASKCGCAGDTNNPSAGGCDNCWDFFLVELAYNDGSRAQAGLVGTTNLTNNEVITYNSPCLALKSTARIEITSQTWQAAEFTQINSVMLICNEPPQSELPGPGISFCDGQSVTMSISPIAGATTYQWFDTNGNPVGSNSTSFTFTANEALGSSQSISYTALLASGCKVGREKLFIVNPSPTAILPTTITECEGEDVNITVTGSGGTSYAWSGPGPGNPTPGSVWNIINAQPSASGTYAVTVTNAGCTDIATTTLTIDPGGDFIIANLPGMCENEGVKALSTTQSGNNGAWSGTGVSSNSFDPGMVGPGTYSITFTPSSGGCLNPQVIDVIVIASPNSFVPTSPLESCGLTAASYDLSTLDDEVNGGSGETVIWYEQANQVDEITDPSNYSAVSSTVYAVVSDGSCFSDQQQLDLIVTDGPEIMMPPSIVGCEDIVLNNIIILNQSGNQAYYDMPGGLGNQYLPGHVFTDDITIYAYDESGTCSDEQEIVLTVGKMTNAGPDVSLDTCVLGLIDLQGLVDPSADPGSFTDNIGNPLPDTLDPSTLTVSGLKLTYTTNSVGVCPSDEAKYLISLFEWNDAGPDNSTVICTNETIDINSLTFDNGASGFLMFTDGTANPPTNITMSPGDLPFINEYYYIVDNFPICGQDTALIIVEGLEQKRTTIDGMECSDFETEVFGVMYNISNPSGMEMGLSAIGCDSIVDVDLTFRTENRMSINDVLCIGNEITVNNIVYNEANPQGEETLIGMDQFGCDSIIEIDLTFDSEVTSLLNFTLCAGQDTLINGKLYSETDAIGSASLTSSTGCDSIVNVDLNFAQPTELLISQVLCPDEELIIENEVFNRERLSGMFVSQALNINGCDSIIMVELSIDDTFSKLFDFTICSDESIDINNKTYNAANPSGIDTIANTGSCDSLYIIDLNILLADTTYIQGSFCNDTSFVVNGNTYDQVNPQGTEMISGGAASGCNEYVFIDIEYIQSIEVDLIEVLCLNDSLIINNVTYNSINPVGQEMFLTSNGCDSIVNINLTFEGMEVAIISSLPDCDYASLGELEIDIYEGEEFLLDLLLNGVSVLKEYQNNTRLLNLLPGDYVVEFIDIRGCSEIRNFKITSVSKSEISVDAEVLNDSYYQITSSFTGQIESIRWTPITGLSCTDCENPEARPEIETTYIVEVTDVNGCTYQESVTLRFLVNSVLYQPNIFSPNDDGVNDIFFIDSDQQFKFKTFTIFDRWGNMMFKVQNGVTGDSALGWDGDYNLPGVYIYTMTVDFPDGPQTITGEFSLFR